MPCAHHGFFWLFWSPTRKCNFLLTSFSWAGHVCPCTDVLFRPDRHLGGRRFVDGGRGTTRLQDVVFPYQLEKDIRLGDVDRHLFQLVPITPYLQVSSPYLP